MILSNNEINSLFSDILGSNMNSYYKTSLVTKNLGEENYEMNHTKDGAYLFFEAPGFNKTNLKVEMEDGVLYINGKRTYKLNGEELTKNSKLVKVIMLNQLKQPLKMEC